MLQGGFRNIFEKLGHRTEWICVCVCSAVSSTRRIIDILLLSVLVIVTCLIYLYMYTSSLKSLSGGTDITSQETLDINLYNGDLISSLALFFDKRLIRHRLSKNSILEPTEIPKNGDSWHCFYFGYFEEERKTSNKHELVNESLSCSIYIGGGTYTRLPLMVNLSLTILENSKKFLDL